MSYLIQDTQKLIILYLLTSYCESLFSSPSTYKRSFLMRVKRCVNIIRGCFNIMSIQHNNISRFSNSTYPKNLAVKLYQVWVLSCGLNFKSNQKVSGYSHNILPLVYQSTYLAMYVAIVAHRIGSQIKFMINILTWQHVQYLLVR